MTSHARRSFAARLAERPVLLDGAMGTLLFSRGVPQRASLDELVLSRPELVTAVHREYIAAGAEVIETDTFSANRVHLGLLGLADRTAAINRRAAQLAREAREVSGRDVLVAGSIGPVSSPLHGPSHLSDRVAGSSASEQLEGLLEGGIDLVMIETASDVGHLLAAVDAARRACDLPILASLSFDEDLLVADGHTAAEAAAALQAAGVDALGVNCGSGPIAGIDVLEQMAEAAAGTPLLVMPNAGLPGRVGGQFVWAATPAYFAEEVPRFLAAGARLVGGCCGTTPEHVAAMRQALDREMARRGAGTTTAVAAAGGATGGATSVGAAAGPAVPGPARVSGSAAGSSSVEIAAPPTHGPGDRARGGPLRRQRGDRPASLGEHRAHAAVGPAHPRGRRGPRQHQRQCHGARAHGRHGRGLRHPA